MGETILDLLNNVQKDDTSNPNSRVLIIDGLNLYLRTFAVNGMLNDRGVPIGGMMGFMKSLAYAIRETNPTRVMVIYDGAGGSQRRRKMSPNYKGNRKPGKRITRWDAFKNVEEEKQAMKIQFSRLLEYLDTLPINVISIDRIEADDTISYITNNLLKYINIFISKINRKKNIIDLIGISGQTVLHNPQKKISIQLGSCSKISKILHIFPRYRLFHLSYQNYIHVIYRWKENLKADLKIVTKKQRS